MQRVYARGQKLQNGNEPFMDLFVQLRCEFLWVRRKDSRTSLRCPKSSQNRMLFKGLATKEKQDAAMQKYKAAANSAQQAS
jgi:hypothetical protein